MRIVISLLFASSLAFGQLAWVDATSRVEIGHPVSNPTVGTIYAWVLTSSITTTRRIFSYAGSTGGQWSLNISGAGTNRIRCTIDYSTTDADAQSVDNAVTTSEWQFFACTFDGVNAPKVYRGTLTKEAVEVSYVTTPVAPVGTKVADAILMGDIGNLPAVSSWVNGWVGTIDIVNWIPGTALSSAEVVQHQHLAAAHANSQFFCGLGRTNGTGSQLDLSGHANNGTIAGTATTKGSAAVPLAVPAFVGMAQ